ncbi:MAG: hypothetical protein SVO96_00710 [Pseudomonadota bacterium]|nr:hypothetical protein [Pseudomonadota bacterium]
MKPCLQHRSFIRVSAACVLQEADDLLVSERLLHVRLLLGNGRH